MAPEEKSGLLHWLVGIFMGSADMEREKRRLLKSIGKDLSKLRFKFYRPKGEMALPQLAKFFFEVYKVTASASDLTVGADQSDVLKEITIDFHMTDDQKLLRESFSEAEIREKAKTMDPKFLVSKLKEDLVTFISSFDSTLVKQINSSYNSVLRFVHFVRYDYYFTLKKYDSSMAEGNVIGNPKFEAINGEYILDDLKDFLEVALPIQKDLNWEAVFTILATYKGTEIVNTQAWGKVLQILKNVVHAEILTLIIRHLSGDPYWKPTPHVPGEHIVEGYLNKIKSQTETVVQKIAEEKKNAKVDKIVTLVFGGPVPPRIKNYTDRASLSFGRRIGMTYTHTLPINYLKSFLLDFFKKEIRELQDLLLVRGKWTTNVLSQQLSDHYYQTLAVSDKVLAFDDSLGDEGDIGSRLKRSMARVVERDESSARPVRAMVQEINNQAQKIIAEAATILIAFGKSLKSLAEDIDKKDFELIINWKELVALSEVPLKERLNEDYKRLYFFIQLLQVYAKGGTGEVVAVAEQEEEQMSEKAAAVAKAADIDSDELD
ncbi:MAG: hypothetical protein GW949_08190 [Spirochaetales bacterium]|nr:hypothetical protein [Spirochaetales bacterium]